MKVRTRDFIDQAETALLKLPGAGTDMGWLTHRFSEGVYLRILSLPAGALIIGHRHKTSHFNLLLQGTVTILTSDGMEKTVSAPFGFESGPGVRKIGFAHTAVEMCSAHPNPDNCADVAVLENRFVTKSKAFTAWEKRRGLCESPR